MNDNQAIKLHTSVAFGRGTKWECYTLGAGSVVELRYIDWTNNRARVTFGRNDAWVSLDDASLVEWDDLNKMWVES